MSTIFICESVSPDDFYEGRVDGFAANELLKIQSVETTYKISITRKQVQSAIAAASAGRYHAFHLSCHGDDDGIRLTDGTDIDWLEFADMVKSFAEPSTLLIMSCCSGGYVGLSKALEKRGATFGYIFGSTAARGVGFAESCLAWSILYHDLLKPDGLKRDRLRRTLTNINAAVGGDFVYRRWDGTVYRHYPSFSNR